MYDVYGREVTRDLEIGFHDGGQTILLPSAKRAVRLACICTVLLSGLNDDCRWRRIWCLKPKEEVCHLHQRT